MTPTDTRVPSDTVVIEHGGISRRGRQRGTIALEMSILAPMLLLLFMFLFAGGRYFMTSQLLENAARDGARAATQARTVSGAQRAVDDAVERYAGQAVDSCRTTANGTITGRFEPGQAITVEVSCTIDYRDLAFLGIGGDTTLTRRFTSPLDPYRGVRDGSG